MKLSIAFHNDNEFGGKYLKSHTIHNVDIELKDILDDIECNRSATIINKLYQAFGWKEAKPAECNHHPAHYGVVQSECLYCKQPIVKSTDGWVVDTCKFCGKVVKRGTGCVNPHCEIQKSKVHANVPYIEPDPIDLKGFPILDGEEVKYVPMDLYESLDRQATKKAIMTDMYTKVVNKESLAVMLAQDLGYEYTEDDGWQYATPIEEMKYSEEPCESYIDPELIKQMEEEYPNGVFRIPVGDNRHPHADLIHAYAEGAQIDVFIDGEWVSCENPGWYKDHQYRIAQTKPREFWLCREEVGTPWVIAYCEPCDKNIEWIKVREVIENDNN
jgi:hypothetical protein